MNELYARSDKRFAVRIVLWVGMPFLLLMLVGLGYMIFVTLGWPLTTRQILSLLVGVPLGILSALLMRLTWDPVRLRPTNPKVESASVNSWVTPFAVIGAIVFLRLMESLFTPEQKVLFDLGFVTMGIIFLGYMNIAVLIHHWRWLWR